MDDLFCDLSFDDVTYLVEDHSKRFKALQAENHDLLRRVDSLEDRVDDLEPQGPVDEPSIVITKNQFDGLSPAGKYFVKDFLRGK